MKGRKGQEGAVSDTVTSAVHVAPAKVLRSQRLPPRVSAGDVAEAAVTEKGPGAAVDPSVSARVRGHLNVAFAGVRVHTDEVSQEANSAMGSRAFAHGADVFLGQGESPKDVSLMAHELTHVVQQGASKTATPQPTLEVEPTNSPAEVEADRVAAEVVSGPSGLIVEGSGVANGQMEREEFLSRLREAVTSVADDALGPLESAVGCPYIERWFSRHAQTPAAELERLAKRYSFLINANAATDYIPAILHRLRSGIDRWRDGADVSSDLRSAGLTNEAATVKTAAKQGSETVAQKIDSFGPKEKLPGPVAARMGAAMDDNFADVEIHTGRAAANATAEAGAVAMTIGPNIAFSPGAFDPGTQRGDALLAHELAHVQQQRAAAKAQDAPVTPVGAESSTHEEAAEGAAGSALSRLWGRVAKGAKSVAKKANDVVFSPLQLQRCSTGTEPNYEFDPHRAGPHVGQRVGVLAEGAAMVTPKFVHHARKTIGEAESESEAITIAKVANKPAAVIAAEGVFFVYEIDTPRIFNPIFIASAGLKVDDGVIAIVANTNVHRPGFVHKTTSTDATRGSYEEAFEPYLELHDGGLGSISEPEFLAVFEAAMRDNALKVLAESERQAKSKRAQFKGGAGAVSAGEKQTIEDVGQEALVIQRKIEATDAERIQMRNQRSIGPAGPINMPKASEEIALEERLKAQRQQRRAVNLKYPMLGRYGGARELSDFLAKPEAARLGALAGDADEVVRNIYTTRENILTGDLDMWLVPPIIQSTVAGLRVGKDTDQRGWVEAKASAVGSADRNAEIALAVLGIGLGLAAAFASGGAALILTAGAVGVGVYDAVQTTEKHFMHNAAVDTDVDKIDGASLLPESARQHWGWLVLAWAGLGLDVLDVVKVAGQVADISRGMKTVDEAAQALAAGDVKILERLRRAAGDVEIKETISEANRAGISRAVGAEVEIDPRVGRSVEVKYDLDPKTGKIVVSGVRVGDAAKVGDVVGHADTVRMLRRHGTVSSRLLDLWTRLRTLGKRGSANPFPPKSAAFESWAELSKLDTLMAAKRAQLREAMKVATDPAVAQRELRTQLAFLENEFDIHRRVVDSLANDRGARGVIAMSDDTRAALEAGHRLPDVAKGAADISAADLKGSSYYFRKVGDDFEPVLKADKVGDPTDFAPTPVVRDPAEVAVRAKTVKSALPNSVALTDDTLDGLAELSAATLGKLTRGSEDELRNLGAMLKVDPGLASRLGRAKNPYGVIRGLSVTDPKVLSAKLFQDRTKRLRIHDRIPKAAERTGLAWSKLDALTDADLKKLAAADTDLAKARQGHRPGTADAAALAEVERALEGISSLEAGAKSALRAELSHLHGLSDLPFIRDPAAALRAKFPGLDAAEATMRRLLELHPDALRALESVSEGELRKVVRALTSGDAQRTQDVEDMLRSYMYKSQKQARKSKGPLEAPKGVADRLDESVATLEVVRKRGFPYGFASKADYDSFISTVESGLKSRGIDGTPKVQGSSMHNTNPGDIDMEIVVTQAEFERLGAKFVENAPSKEAAESVAYDLAKRKIPSFKFYPDEKPSLASEVVEFTAKRGDASATLDVQATLIVQGSDFDLGPFL